LNAVPRVSRSVKRTAGGAGQMAGRSTRISVALIVAVASLAGFSAVALAATIVGTNDNDNPDRYAEPRPDRGEGRRRPCQRPRGQRSRFRGAGDDTVNGRFRP